jgi:gliding motility-associated-like protein
MKHLFGCMAFLFALPMFSTHIAGGDFTVRHIEGNTFEAKLILYRDCEGNLVIDPSITIAVYNAGNNQLINNLSFNMSNPVAELIPLSNSCYDTGLCVESQTYIQQITLPNNPEGYYLSWERCCRNEIAVNVTAALAGMVFTVEVPDPALQNSSPEFLPYPAGAFLCINSVAEIDFAATDVDGDSLVYTLVDPLRGDGTNNLDPINPIGAGPKPYSTIAWALGYGIADPVGGDTPLTLDSQTGLAMAQPTNLGFYSLAVQVDEYRNGVKIGAVIREVQIAALVCNVDLPSVILTPNNDTIFNLLANSNFCIEITVTDPNEGDTLFVQAAGPIMDGTVFPSASYPDADGFSTIIQEFCWSPLCQNVSDEPYVVTLTAFSRGCANEILITTQDLYFNVFLEVDEPTALANPLLDDEPGVVIDLYDPTTHCFDIVFEDPNTSDSIFVTASSAIFSLPNAQSLEPDEDKNKVTLPFCWNVECIDVRDEPYFIDFEVLTTNCEVEEITTYTVPVYVIVPENEPTTFAEPMDTYTFEFYSADTFCIPVSVFDQNFFDTLQVTATSELFTLPNAAQFDTLNGTSLVEGQLCWVPQCSDVRPEPYLVTFTATANSCKTNDIVEKTIEIYMVLPPENLPTFELPAPGLELEHFVGAEVIDFPVFGSDPNPYDTLTVSAVSSAFESPGNPASFPAATANGGVLSYFNWDPSCQDISSDSYLVTFEVNSRSCQKNVSVFLDVEILITTPTKGDIRPIPNVFTPNRDGLNDAWTIEHKNDFCLQNFNTVVFDRWGKEVFQSNDPTFGWDGSRDDGSEAADGVYFQVIKYFYKDSNKSYSGNIQVLGSNPSSAGR